MEIYLASAGEEQLLGNVYIAAGFVTNKVDPECIQQDYRRHRGVMRRVYKDEYTVIKGVAQYTGDKESLNKRILRVKEHLLFKLSTMVKIDRIHLATKHNYRPTMWDIQPGNNNTLPPEWFLFKDIAYLSRSAHLQSLNIIYPQRKFLHHRGYSGTPFYLETLEDGLTPYHHSDVPENIVSFVKKCLLTKDIRALKFRKYFVRLPKWWQTRYQVTSLLDYLDTDEQLLYKQLFSEIRSGKRKGFRYSTNAKTQKQQEIFQKWLTLNPPV